MESPLPPDPYHALGVPKDATYDTIRLAHRKLVLTCHPDKVTDEKAKAIKTEQFQQVQQAYEILSDESKRKRYDERAKLAELRAEILGGGKFGNNTFPSRTQDYTSRPTATTSYETRDNAIYETREPKQEKERTTRYHSPSEDYLSARYDNLHSVPRKQSERTEYRPSRRSTGPVPEDSRRSKARDYDDYEDTHVLRERENEKKMREQAAHAERRKKRDKDRKQDYQFKQSARVDLASESDSEYESRRESKRYNPEPKRKYESSRYTVKSTYPDSESDLETKHMSSAMNHIHKKETRPTIYRYVTKDGRPPAAASVPQSQPPPPPPPPPASIYRYRDEIVDTPRRSSGRSRSSRDDSRSKISREDRRPSVIDVPEPRRPSLPTHTSEPAHIRIPPSTDRRDLPRSATMETRSKPTKISSASRAATTPLASKFSSRYNSDSDRMRSSKTKADIYESPGSSSRSASPDFQKPIRYKISHNSSDDRGNARVVSLEPERHSRSTREISPHAKRPSISTRATTSARVSSSRNNSYAPDYTSVPVRPHTGRSETFHESHRSPIASTGRSKTLFGEVSYSPRISTKDAIYSNIPKSASASYYDREDDHHKYESRSRPTVTRREPYRHGETVH